MHRNPVRWSPRRVVLSLAILASAGVVISTILLASPPLPPSALAKIPPDVLQKIEGGQPQDLIVVFDDQEIARDADEMRGRAGLQFEDDKILALKAARYDQVKRRVLTGLFGVTRLDDFSHLPMTVIRIENSEGLSALLRHPDILSLNEMQVYRLALAESLPLIHQPAAQAAGKIGTGTTVAIMDDGVYWPIFGTCPTVGAPGCSVIYVQDFATNDNSTYSDSGHGTNVAAIALGVAPDTRIASLDVGEADGTIHEIPLVNAINWAIQNRQTYNIVAMNLSVETILCQGFQTDCDNGTYFTAFKSARAAGILPVAASGNEGFTGGVSAPACAPGAVRVGAVWDSNLGSISYPWCGHTCTDSTTAADKIACFSNSAFGLTLLAPGGMITAGLSTLAGTSQAAPHVTGSVAVLRAANAFPTDGLCKTTARLTKSGVNLTDPRNGVVTPRVDIGAAIGTPNLFKPFVCSFPGAISSDALNGNYDNVVVGDYDGDGRQDLYVHRVSDGANRLFLSSTEGTFVLYDSPISPGVINGNPTTVLAADFSGDGKSDLLFHWGSPGTNRLYVSTGAGTFTQYLDPLPTSSVNGSPTVLSGDFNGDLKVDLFVHYGSSGNNRLYHSNGNGTFTQYLNPITPGSINGSPSSVLVGDFNADGKRDLFIHYASSGNNRLYHSNGNGTFAQFFNPIGPSAVNGNPTGVRVGDVNGDGKADVYFHWGAAGTNRLYQSNGNATFTQFLDPINAQGINGNPTSFLIGDFNGDGKADALFYWKTTGVNRFYLSTGPGTFMQFLSPINENAINGSPDKVRVGDFNGDGIGDLYFIWGPVGTNRLFVLE